MSFSRSVFIDRSIEAIIEQKVDYLKYDSKQVIHQGTEVLSNNCFKKILNFKESSLVKEHVTPIIYKESNIFKFGKMRLQSYEKRNGIRL